ncbi:MAG: lysostaphin resistance A-like protein [Planctomycetota bacterium]|jgi:membrane protease YdiL (CAAX protease family)
MPCLPVLLLVLFVATATVGASPVIAAPAPIDHTGLVAEGGSTMLVRLAILLAAVLAVALIVVKRWASLRGMPPRPVTFTPLTGLLLALACVVLASMGAVAAARVFGIDVADGAAPSRADQVKLGLGALAGELIIIGLYAWRVVVARRPDPDTRASWWRAAGIGVAAMLLVWPVLAVVGWGLIAIVEWIDGAPPDPIAHETLRVLVESPADGWYAALVFIVVVGAPVTEELLYRGLLQEAMRRSALGAWAAIMVTAAIFALMHVGITTPHTLVLLFGLGVGFGWVYERTGRLTAPIAMHALFNVGNVVMATWDT